MDNTQTNMIEKCKANLTRERMIKAVLCGMAIGLGVSFIIAFTTWFFEFKGLWLSLGVGLAVWAASSVLFYFFKFKPTTADVMKRLDRAGLDERMITMYELQNDDSYIASLQRSDASVTFTKAVAKTGGKLLHTKIPALVIALACTAGGVGVAANVVTGLSDYGVIPTATQLITGNWSGGRNDPGKREFTVTFKFEDEKIGRWADWVMDREYDADGEILKRVLGADGEIDLTLTQKVRVGHDSEPIEVEIKNITDEEGKEYFFIGYFDEKGNLITRNPNYSVENVEADVTIEARYAEFGEKDIYFGYYYDPDNNSDKKSESENGEGDSPDSAEEAPPSGGDGLALPGPPGGVPTDPADTIIDGDTQYKELFDKYQQLAMEMLVNGTENYPPELVELIEGYFGILDN